jgi:type III restriction enzyme
MELQFDANQEFQVRTIDAVVGLLDGQPRIEEGLALVPGAGCGVIANRLDLDEETLLRNLRTIQAHNHLPQDHVLHYLAGTGEGERFANFSVEMETGTGKTYVYLRTALELFRRYGLRKFIIVVPSVAVREGVLKTLQVTEKHLRRLYANPPYHYCPYDSADPASVRHFAVAGGVEILVMTIDSFNKASNVIRQATDRLQGETPLCLVRATRPVLILDEPQNLESELRVQALAALTPLLALRYSATHRNPYHLVYRLTPYDAYRQGLVKRIEVAGIEQDGVAAHPFVRLEGIQTRKKAITAAVVVRRRRTDGTLRESAVTVRRGDALCAKTGRPEYAGFVVDEVNAGGGFVRFANGVRLRRGEAYGPDREALVAAQLRYTIRTHFEKQCRLRPLGIKVLSLFFIDRVDHYVRLDGLIRRLFRDCFNEAKADFEEWADCDPEAVQAAYFARCRGRDAAEQDREAYHLILRDRETLLSFPTPADGAEARRRKQVCFLFSHSALREGWDNPNVLQICTLNPTHSEVKKRQEVGRGMRLVVNQAGQRVPDETVNVLTVVANESYQQFVAALQAEVAADYRAAIEARHGKPLAGLTDAERRRVEEEYGHGILPPRPANARARVVVRSGKEYRFRPEFRERWLQIRHQASPPARIDTARLVDEVAAELARRPARPARLTATRATVQLGPGAAFAALPQAVVDLGPRPGRRPLPNLVDLMANLMECTAPPVRLTRRTLLAVFRRAPNPEAALDDPHAFATLAVRLIKDKLAGQLAEAGPGDEFHDGFKLRPWVGEAVRWREHLVPAAEATADGCARQQAFRQWLERRPDVQLYGQPPAWFAVPTLLGDEQPDWVVLRDGSDTTGPVCYLARAIRMAAPLVPSPLAGG